MDKSPLEQAVALAGSQSALAKAISPQPDKVKQGHIWAWINRFDGAPVEYCPAIERVTGIKCEALRPDVTWTRDTSGQITGYHVALPA